MILKNINFLQKKNSNQIFENKLSKFSFNGFDDGNDDGSFNPCPLKNIGDWGCNPWSSCDAWNCAPDCRCKDNMA